MGSIYRENWKRGAKKSSVSAMEGHDLVRVEDLGAISSSGFITIDEIPASGTAEGDILVADALGAWTLLPRSTTDGYVLKTLSGTLAWAPDASGSGGGSGSVDLSASGFLTVDDIPGSGTAEGDILVADALGAWTLLPRSTVDGYVLKTLSGNLAWAPDASGTGGAAQDLSASGFMTAEDIAQSGFLTAGDIGEPNLSASGFVVGPNSATNNGVVTYDGNTGELVGGTNDFTWDGTTALVDGILQVSILAQFQSKQAWRPMGLTVDGTVLNTRAVNLISSTMSSGNLDSSPTDGSMYIIKDADGVAGSAPITIDGNGTTIDGDAQITLVNNYESVTLIYASNGNEWHVI